MTYRVLAREKKGEEEDENRKSYICSGDGISDSRIGVWRLALSLDITAGVVVTEDVIINAIMYSPPGTDTHHEWLELYNKDTKAINITGWKFYEDGTNHSLTLEQGSMTIPVAGYAIIADNATMFLNEHPECTCTVIDSVFSLRNTEEYIALKNATLDIIDDVTYNVSWGADGNGRTLELNETGGWEESRVDGGTPCKRNSVLEDREAPIVINATATPSTIAVNTENITLHVDVADKDICDINNVTIDLSPIGKSQDTVMSIVGCCTRDNLMWYQFEHETSASVTGTFNLTVNATDICDNYNNTVNITLTVISESITFDTGPGTYPSIRGTHNGTIILNQTMEVHRIYTYPCFKTDGHSEYVAFYNNSGTSEEIANGTWIGTYLGSYQWITFDKSFTLKADVTYNYTIRTGCYPQIHHTHALDTGNGIITCTEFIDANSRVYNDWIPAIKLE